MRSFLSDTVEVEGDSEVAPARIHPGKPDYVMVPVRWTRDERHWMESPGLVICLPDDIWLAGYSMGHHFGDMLHLNPTEIEEMVGSAWPTFADIVANSARGDFTTPALHRVPDPDTFCTPPSVMTFVGLAVRRLPGTRDDEFGILVMDSLYGLLDVCVSLQRELAACPCPVAIWRRRRVVPRPRRTRGPDASMLGGACRLDDLARRLVTSELPTTPAGTG